MRALIFFIIFSYFITEVTNGQLINCDWIDFSTGEDSYCSSLDCDNENNVYITGYFKHLVLGSYDLISKGASSKFNAFVAKYNSDSHIEWLNHFGNIGNCMGEYITCDSEGNAIVAGNFEEYFYLSGQFFNSLGYNDIFLIKYGSNGQVIWTRQIKSQSNIKIKSLDCDLENNIYLFVYGSQVEITYFENIQVKSAFLIAKYDAFGNILWVKETFRGNDYSSSIPLTVSDNGDIYYTGAFKDAINFADTAFISKGYWQKEEEFPDSFYISTDDFFVSKMNSNGNEDWIRVISNLGNEYGIHSTTNNNDIFIAGYFSDSLSIDSTITLTNGGVFLLKYDTIGSLLNKHSDNVFYNIENITCDEQNVFVTGNRNSDIFVDKYDLNLKLLQSFETGDWNADCGNTIAIDNNGLVLLGGVFLGEVEFGEFIIKNSFISFNLFIAGLNNDMVPINSTSYNNEFILFPNPVADKLNIRTDFPNQKININIINSTGTILLSKIFLTDNEGYVEINSSSLNNGIYILQIKNEFYCISKFFLKI